MHLHKSYISASKNIVCLIPHLIKAQLYFLTIYVFVISKGIYPTFSITIYAEHYFTKNTNESTFVIIIINVIIIIGHLIVTNKYIIYEIEHLNNSSSKIYRKQKTAIENEKRYRKVENTNRIFHFPLYTCHRVQNGKTLAFSLFPKSSKKY